jgi:hypothetical protein
MQINVALRGRTRLAALLQHLEQEADQREQDERCDQRNRRTWRQLILGVLVARSTRLVALGRVVAPQRRVGSVKAAAMALTYFLQRARVPVPELSTGLLEAAVRQLDPETPPSLGVLSAAPGQARGVREGIVRARRLIPVPATIDRRISAAPPSS